MRSLGIVDISRNRDRQVCDSLVSVIVVEEIKLLGEQSRISARV